MPSPAAASPPNCPVYPRLWLRLDAERHRRLRAKAAELGISGQALLRRTLASLLRQPAEAAACSARSPDTLARPSADAPRVKIGIRVLAALHARVMAMASARGQSCQSLLVAALDLHLERAEQPLPSSSEAGDRGTAEIVPLFGTVKAAASAPSDGGSAQPQQTDPAAQGAVTPDSSSLRKALEEFLAYMHEKEQPDDGQAPKESASPAA